MRIFGILPRSPYGLRPSEKIFIFVQNHYQHSALSIVINIEAGWEYGVLPPEERL